MFNTLRTGSMRRMRPLRTLAGPISIKVVIPWAAIYSTHWTHWTDSVIWRAKFKRVSSAAAWGLAVTLLSAGIVVWRMARSFKDSANLDAAEDIKDEWNAPL